MEAIHHGDVLEQSQKADLLIESKNRDIPDKRGKERYLEAITFGASIFGISEAAILIIYHQFSAVGVEIPVSDLLNVSYSTLILSGGLVGIKAIELR